MDKERKQEIEDEFLEWRVSLDEEQQEKVEYSEVDGYLRMLFVTVEEDFDLEQTMELERRLRDMDPDLRVGLEEAR